MRTVRSGQCSISGIQPAFCDILAEKRSESNPHLIEGKIENSAWSHEAARLPYFLMARSAVPVSQCRSGTNCSPPSTFWLVPRLAQTT